MFAALAIPNPGLGSYLLFCLATLLTGSVFTLALRHREKWAATWPAWLRTIALNIFATIFFTTAIFLAFETYYRFLYDSTSLYNYTFVSDRWFKRYYHFNSAGVRDNIEYDDEIPGGKRRITFIGDSFTAAQGVKDVEDRFANLIRQAHPDWDIQVMAIPGYDTSHELGAVKRLIDHSCPLELVVLVYCLNDIGDLIPEWQKALSHINDDQDQRNWLVDHSYFADMMYFHLVVRRNPNIPDFFKLAQAAYAGPLWQRQQERLANLANIVNSSGARLVVVTWPFLDNLGPQYPFKTTHEQLGQFWQTQNVPHLDLLPVLKNFPPSKLVVNELDNHPNEFAHATAATAINQFLAQQIKTLPPKKSAP